MSDPLKKFVKNFMVNNGLSVDDDAQIESLTQKLKEKYESTVSDANTATAGPRTSTQKASLQTALDTGRAQIALEGEAIPNMRRKGEVMTELLDNRESIETKNRGARMKQNEGYFNNVVNTQHAATKDLLGGSLMDSQKLGYASKGDTVNRAFDYYGSRDDKIVGALDKMDARQSQRDTMDFVTQLAATAGILFS